MLRFKKLQCLVSQTCLWPELTLEMLSACHMLSRGTEAASRICSPCCYLQEAGSDLSL